MKADAFARSSAAVRNKAGQEKRFLKLFDGVGFDDIVIIIATSRRGEWEIQVRLPSGCIRRRNKKELKS